MERVNRVINETKKSTPATAKPVIPKLPNMRLALLAAILLAVGSVEFFFFSAGGLGWTIFWLLFLPIYALIFLLKDKKLAKDSKKFAPLDVVSIILIVLLSLPFMLYNNPVLWFLNTLSLMALVSTLYLRQIFSERLDSLRFIVELTLGTLARPFAKLREAFLTFSSSKSDNAKSRRRNLIIKTVWSVVAASVIVAILATLLAASDLVFAEMLGRIGEWFNSLNLGDFIWHIFLMLLVFPFCLSFILTYILKTKYTSSLELEYAGKKVLPTLPVAIVLSFINLLYLVFAIIQFKFLFSGGTQLPDGITYADYARAGFFQLSAISIINVIIVAITVKFSERNGRAGTLLRILSVALVALAAVQVASSWLRMSLYVQVYGLSQLRLFVFTALIVIAAIFVVLILREFIKKVPLFTSIAAIILFVLVGLNYIVPDAKVAQYNINHYLSGDIKNNDLDLDYLWDLSNDSRFVIMQNRDQLIGKNPKFESSLADFSNRVHFYTDGRGGWKDFNVMTEKLRQYQDD